jgi:hypothetical protein
VASGALIGESLRVGATLEPPGMCATTIVRAECGDTDSGQPSQWTFIEFELRDADASAWAEMLQAALCPELGWYCDFRTADETFVVFAGRVFRYPRGDEHGRGEAAQHARSVGVPEHQLDWPE